MTHGPDNIATTGDIVGHLFVLDTDSKIAGIRRNNEIVVSLRNAGFTRAMMPFGRKVQIREQNISELVRFALREEKLSLQERVKNLADSTAEVALAVSSVIETYGQTSDGPLIHALDTTWRCIVKRLNRDWKEAMMIPSRVWEEMIAAAFDQEGYDEVILTPQSGDHGRDVIAIRRGIGCVRIIGSVKAYKPGHLVTHDDVRALAGVLHGDPKASKGIITTTSDFAPRIGTDPYIAPLMPFRLELMNGNALQSWLSKVAGLDQRA